MKPTNLKIILFLAGSLCTVVGCGGGMTGGMMAGSEESLRVSWTPPTTNEDGTPLTDLAGYRIHYGSTPNAYDRAIEVPNPGLKSHVILGLRPGTYYFAVTAFDFSGNESALSHEVTNTVGSSSEL